MPIGSHGSAAGDIGALDWYFKDVDVDLFNNHLLSPCRVLNGLGLVAA
jgi:hypothetical protein